MWNYAALPGVLGNNDAVVGIKVSTEEELEKAMLTALKTTDKLIFIEACIVNRDASFGLERLGNTFRSAQQKK